MTNVNRKNAITAMRQRLMDGTSITEELLVSVCAAMGLASLFAGIWLGDGQFAAALDSGHSTLVMRAFTFLIYALFLATVCRLVGKGPFDLQAFFFKTVSVGLVCFAASCIGLTWLAHTGSSPNATAGLWTAFFLSKIVGAPLTIGLVCVFSQLGRKATMRLSIIGILGAFVIYSISSQAIGQAAGLSAAKLGLSALLVVASCVFGMFGLNNEMFGRIHYTQDEMMDSHVIKRPAREVIDGGILLTVMFSAVALGYLRSGYVGSDAHLQPASIVVLLIVVIISLLRQNLRIEHLFTCALFCTACSILLEPFLSVWCPVAITLLANTGTALFEVIVWCWAVWVTRNSQETLTAASIMRLATVAGHLLGTIAVAMAMLVVSDDASAAAAAGMLVILFYLIEIAVVVRTPSWTLPILTVEDDSTILPPVYTTDTLAADAPDSSSNNDSRNASATSEAGDASDIAAGGNAGNSSVPTQDANAAANASQPQAPSPADIASFEELYWDAPLATVADTYRLTKREREVLGLLARGHSFAAMEETLCISHNTMKMHARNIYTKMEVHSRQDVISMVDLVRENQRAERGA